MPKRTNTINLIKRVIDALAPTDDDVYYWDEKLPGFGLRIRNRTTRTYIVRYRTATGQRKRTLGTHGVITPAHARKLALQWLGDIHQGHDPAETRDHQRRDALTMAQLCERYMAEYAQVHKKPKSIRLDGHNIRLYILPHFGRMPVAAVSRADVLKLHGAMRATPIAANRVLALLSKMFNLAEEWGWREPRSNPVWRLQRYPETKKDRYLTPEELQRLGAVLQDAERTQTTSPVVLAAIRLLMFTGCRHTEILTLRWDEVDLAQRCVRLRDSKTGAKVIQLNAPACAVLHGITRHDASPYVFPGIDPAKPRANITRAWYQLRQRAGLPDVRLHDLRHSFASFGVSLGLSLPMVGKLLGHADAATTQRYSHLHDDPLRDAVEQIGAAMTKAMRGD